jgi:shikimate kinase
MPSNAPHKIRESLTGPIVLVGMMGAGKTHVGRLLAAELGVDFEDTDALIEQKLGMGIPSIFAKQGEQVFRSAESDTLKDVLSGPPAVISTGGGIVLADENLALIKKRSLSIWLDVAPEVLWARLKNDTGRPLLQSADPQKTLSDLLQARKRRYAEADLRVEIGDERADATLARLIKMLSEHLNTARF